MVNPTDFDRPLIIPHHKVHIWSQMFQQQFYLLKDELKHFICSHDIQSHFCSPRDES